MEKLNSVLSSLHNTNIKFPIKTTTEFLHTPISNLELDNRSYNALSRNGINTVEDILNNMPNLTQIKSYGNKSFNKTMYALCVYQYNLLSEEGKQKYLTKIIELNTCNENLQPA